MCLAALSDLAACSQIGDGESTGGQHELGGQVVGIDRYRGWVV